MERIDKETLIKIHNAYENLYLGHIELAYDELGEILEKQLKLTSVIRPSELLFCMCEKPDPFNDEMPDKCFRCHGKIVRTK